jgi:signal transduction histidine kinase
VGEKSLDGITEKALSTIPRAICELTAARGAILFAVDPASLALEAVAAHGVDEEKTRGLRIEIDTLPIAAEALRTQKAVTYDDRRAARGPVQALGFGRLTCVPIVTGNDAVGIVFFDQARRYLRIARTRRRLDEIARLAATALVAARAERRAGAWLDEARSLFEVSRSLSSSLDSREVLTRVAWGICVLTGARRSAVVAYEPATAFLCGVAGHGVDRERVTAFRTRLDDSRLAQLALLSGRPESAAELSDRSDPVGSALGFEPAHCVPLRSPDDLLGVIYVEAGTKGHAGSPLDHDLLSEFAAVAAMAIQNARSYRRARMPIALAQASYAARDLHDGVAQHLYVIGAAAGRLLAADGSTPALRREHERIRAVAGRASSELREALRVLSSGKPALLGLGPALDALVSDTRERTELEIELEVAPALRDADDAVAELLYRACREGLTNVERHAQAKRCWIRCSTDHAWATAVVDDDGRSFDGIDEPGHFGLSFLREAFEAMEGAVEIRARRPSGTVLTASIRLDAPNGDYRGYN